MQAEYTPSQSAVLELREEKTVVLEAYDFLDEKRLLLAAELLRQLADFEKIKAQLEQLRLECHSAISSAIQHHGLHGIQLQSPAESDAECLASQRSFMGVTLVSSQLVNMDNQKQSSAINPSPEIVAAGKIHQELLQLATVAAGISGNLHRLMNEYRKTERRARALENVVIPEIEEVLSTMSSQLEEIDQEETIRTHRGHQHSN